MTAEELAESIARWVARNAEQESALLSSDPQFAVNAHLLLDHVRDVTGVGRDQIDEWVDSENATKGGG